VRSSSAGVNASLLVDIYALFFLWCVTRVVCTFAGSLFVLRTSVHDLFGLLSRHVRCCSYRLTCRSHMRRGLCLRCTPSEGMWGFSHYRAVVSGWDCPCVELCLLGDCVAPEVVCGLVWFWGQCSCLVWSPPPVVWSTLCWSTGGLSAELLDSPRDFRVDLKGCAVDPTNVGIVSESGHCWGNDSYCREWSRRVYERSQNSCTTLYRCQGLTIGVQFPDARLGSPRWCWLEHREVVL